MGVIKERFIHKDNSGFNYYWEGKVKGGDTVILRFPPVTANKRGVNDIGWQIDGDAALWATTVTNPYEADAMWQEIHDYEDINKCATAVRIVGGEGESRAIIRIIMN